MSRASNENKVSGFRGIKGTRADERESTGAVVAKNTINDKRGREGEGEKEMQRLN